MSDISFSDRLKRIESERGVEFAANPVTRPSVQTYEDRAPAPASALRMGLIGFAWPFATLLFCAALPSLNGMMSTLAPLQGITTVLMLVFAAAVLMSIVGLIYVLARTAIQMNTRPDRIPLGVGVVIGFVAGLLPLIMVTMAV